MSVYSETTTFVRACAKAVTKLTAMPEAVAKSSYAAPDVLGNAKAILAAAESVSAAARAVIECHQPPKPAVPEVHNHYGPRPTDSGHRGATLVAT